MTPNTSGPAGRSCVPGAAPGHDRFDELAELRTEIRRVSDIAQAAIDALRSAGHEQDAARLQRDLGTAVEMLRGDDPAG